MAEPFPQTFENHSKRPTSMLVCCCIMLAAAVMAVIGLFFVKSIVGLCLVGTATALLALTSIYALAVIRSYATKLQDRIIRTEMRLRLENILPSEQQQVIPNLTVNQLVALRFASDAELPDLVGKVVDEDIHDMRTIKQSIKDWQGDYFRV